MPAQISMRGAVDQGFRLPAPWPLGAALVEALIGYLEAALTPPLPLTRELLAVDPR